VAEILVECQGMIEPQARSQDIQMSFPAAVTPFFVLADRIRVKQVLLNLLSNAIKYNVEHGQVEVACGESGPGRVRISVRDTGRGLAPEQLTQLFQPFNRLGQEASGVEGTGIGLVVAKRLVELMDGVIGVESVVGGGSLFWFELAAVARPELLPEAGGQTASAAPPDPAGARTRTVLYVEDNPANLKLVELILARHPTIRLLTAVDGNSGIELARGAGADVILLDINLPGMNGFEVLKFLRSVPATAAIPVIAISANAMATDVEKGLKAGFFRYLTKPIKVNEFVEVLGLALGEAESPRP
jgi:CheY-like chemotaxis protein